MMHREMVVDEMETRTERGHHTVSAWIRTENHKDRLFFRWYGEICDLPGDAFLLAAIRPAMALGCNLIVRHVVSEHLAIDIPNIQDKLRNCSGGLSLIDIEFEKSAKSLSNRHSPEDAGINIKEPVGDQRKTGLFFTGDLDSFFALHRHREDIDTFVCVPNFDTGDQAEHIQSKTVTSARYPARELKKEFLILDTNLKHFFSPFGMARGFDFNRAFAVLGTILSGHLTKLYIPQSHLRESSSPEQYIAFCPSNGAHRMSFSHDGADLLRGDKIAAMAGDRTLLDVIRTCWENPGRSYNCGRCSTCTRTLSAYQCLSALD